MNFITRTTYFLKAHHIKFMILCCVFFLQSGINAQTENAKPEQRYIKGRILDINTMKSIPSVQVIVKNEEGETIVLKFSDADGNYKMNNLEIGNYSITIKQGRDYDVLTQKFSVASDDNLSMNFYLRKRDVSETEEADSNTSEILPVNGNVTSIKTNE